MTTAADIALKAMREVTDVMTGSATAGAATSLTDTVYLTQPPAHWDNGTLWILSGTHAGKAMTITSYTNNKLTFPTLGATPIAAANRYAVARAAYPWAQIVTAINQAMDETYVEDTDSTLVGDGVTLEFTLPTGVYDIKNIHFIKTDRRAISTHWKEKSGLLRFDYGYPPCDDDAIEITFKARPTEVTLYSDVISDEIDIEWLRHKVAEQLLWWGIGVYGNVQEYRIEERMNKVLAGLKGKYPRRDMPEIKIRTAGA